MTATPDPPAVQVYALGGFRVLVRGRLVEDQAWRRKSARQLFKHLLTRPSRRMTRDEMIEQLWPESETEAAATNVRSTLHALRRVLEPADAPSPTPVGIVFSDRDSVWLRTDVELWLDADAFDRTLEQARQTNDPQPLLEQAGALYIGDYLPDDLYEDEIIQRREALRRSWTNLQFERAKRNVEGGRPEAAVASLQRLLRADRCDERAAQELMVVLLQLRRRAEALRVYQQLEQGLREDLGVLPAERTHDLQRQAAATHTAAGPQSGKVFHCAYTFPRPHQIIGRDTDLARLQTLLDRGRTSGQAVLISAPAGTGKSALAGRLVDAARRSGVLCLAGAAYNEHSAVPLAAFQEAFTDYVLAASSNPLDTAIASAASELIAAVRELRLHAAVVGASRTDASAERSRIFTALLTLLRILADRSPVLLCLEDLHAADEATLHLLHYLIRQTRRWPVLFVGTIRSEAVQPGEPLAQLTTALIREQLVEQLELAPLDKAATDQLVFLLAGGPVSSEMSASVYAATDGNPLFVEQLVLALRDDGRLTGRVGPTQQIVADISNVPVVVRELIEERLRRLSARARTTLEAAAVLGDTFNYGDLLAVLAPEDEATLLTDLDEAIQGQLLRERPTGFAFGHSLMRDGIYWGLSRPRRMLLHGRTASVLEQRAGAHAPDMAAELAHHFASAGRARPAQERALRYSLRAGRESAALASNREALHHFEIACEVIDRGAVDVDNSTRISALEGRGNAERSTGIWARCIATFRAVLELATDPVTRATAHQILSFALQHVGDTAAALAEAEKGLAAAAAEPDPHQAAIARIKLQSQLAMLWFLRGRFEDLLQLGNEMVELAQQVDEPRWLAWAQYVPCWAHTGSGRTRLAIEHYALQLASAEAGGDKLDVAGAHTNLGLELYRAGRFAESEPHLEQGVAMYRDSFSELRAVLALQGLGWTHLAQGRIGRAQEYADISMALAAEARDRWLADCLELSGALDMLHASWDSAEDCLAQALEIRQRVGHVASTVDTLLRLGRLSEYRAQDDRADDFFDRAVRIADTMDPAPCVVNAHLCRGVRLLRHGDVAAGAVDIEHARHLAESMQESLVDAAVLLAMAELHQQRGDLSAALSAAERALAAPHTAEFSVDAHLRFAALLSAAGRHDKGRVQTAAAIRVATELGAEHLLPLQRRPA